MEIKSTIQTKGGESYQFYPLGDSAVELQFGESVSPEIQQKISCFLSYLEKHSFPGMIELVPAFTTLTIYFNPWILSEKGKKDPFEQLYNLIQTLLKRDEEPEVAKQRTVEIPVCYGGEFGPDLEFVASYNHLTPEEVVGIHSGGDYLVYMMGFAPGFPYMGGMDNGIATPRKDTPRTYIPKGSVGIGGEQTGIYPLETPGGWQLIGSTPLCLFDPQREPASLLRAGDKVRFVPVSLEEYHGWKGGAG